MGYPKAEGRVRYVAETELFELQCRSCKEYVELVPENWRPKSGLTRCAACWAEYSRLKQQGYRASEANQRLARARGRTRYYANHQANLEARRVWRAANKERVAAYNREYRARHRERLLEQSRAYYEECRDVLLMKKRQAYADGKAA